MLTLVGNDQPGIVAKITNGLLNANCNLGEASMMRLGGNFTVMLMINSEHPSEDIRKAMQSTCDDMSLTLHIDQIRGRLHQHHIPDVRVVVSGSDRAGIVAQVSQLLFDAGMDILDLNSDVAGTNEAPIYIMQIEGLATQGIDSIEKAIDSLPKNIDVSVHPIETFVG